MLKEVCILWITSNLVNTRKPKVQRYCLDKLYKFLL